MPPSGLPDAFLEDVPDALRELPRATRARADRSPPPSSRARFGVDMASPLRELEARRRAGPRRASAAVRPGRARRARVVRRRGAAAPAPRVAGGAAPRDRAGRAARARRASCRPGRASTATPRPAPESSACARCSCRCRAWRCPPSCGSATCCRGASAPTRRAGSISSAPPVRSCGSARARSPPLRPRRALLPRDAAAIGPPAAAAKLEAPGEPEHELIRERLRAGALLLQRPARRARRRRRGAPGGALGSRLGRRGDQRRVGAAARAAARARPRPAPAAARSGRRFAPALRSSRAQTRAPVQGRWSLVGAAVRAGARPGRAGGARSPSCCSSATAS